jgi:general secretion pathway protein B
MSLILDALNRSRQDSDEIPGLATQHYVDDTGGSAGQGRQYLLWLALLVALVIIGGLLVDRNRQPEPPVPVSANASPPVAQSRAPEPVVTVPEIPAAEPVPAVPAQPLQQTRPETVAEPAVAEPPEVASVPSTSAGGVADLYRQQETSPAAAEIERVAEPAMAAEQEVETQEQPIDIEKLVLQARDEMENAQLSEHSAPFLSALSQQTKDAIPTIYYRRHDYSDTQAKSTVVLNGKTLKPGGSPGAGLKVDEILPDSVVLNYRGTQFRLRALNSWINL